MLPALETCSILHRRPVSRTSSTLQARLRYFMCDNGHCKPRAAAETSRHEPVRQERVYKNLGLLPIVAKGPPDEILARSMEQMVDLADDRDRSKISCAPLACAFCE